MWSEVEKLVAPAAFLATQVYSPMWSALADSIDRLLIFLPILLMKISSLLSISVLLKYHEIVIGESPLATVHVTEITSPAFMVSSPNENGMI